MTCRPVDSPDGNGTGIVSTGRPARLAGVVRSRSRRRLAGVQSAFASAGNGDAAMTRHPGRNEMTALPDLNLQFGDRVRVVGEPDRIKQVTAVLGNSTKALNHTQFISVFVGIMLGVLIGSIPVQIMGMPAPSPLAWQAAPWSSPSC